MFKQFQDKIQYAAIAAPIFAQNQINLSPGGDWKSLGGITANSIISGAISLVLLVVSLVFFFILIYGGLRWIMSEGDEKAVASARNQITNALIGLAIVFSAFAILQLLHVIFGINLLSNLKIPSFTGQ